MRKKIVFLTSDGIADNTVESIHLYRRIVSFRKSADIAVITQSSDTHPEQAGCKKVIHIDSLGANQDTADNYFCKYYIEGITYCQQCDKNCPCQCKDRIFKPMTLEIAPNKFDENQNKHEISYGSIERIQKKCNDYGIRRFYGYNKNDYKYLF